MASGYDKIGETEENINETTAILKKNVTKVMERGEKLDAISERSEQLERSANTFRVHSTRVRRTMWLKNRWLIVSIIVIVIAIVILIIVLTLKPWNR
jgi:t-SNARE complex subunit (syntaxin)